MPDLPERTLFVLDGVRVEVDGRILLDLPDEHLHAGRCTAVVGPSGSGKSTLLRLLNRLREPSAGRILLDGRDIRDLDVLRLRRRAVLVPQQAVALTGRVRDEVRVAAPALDDDAVDALLRRVALDPTEHRDRDTSSLSGGELQRVCLARALAVGPEVLLLDEPTSALDPGSADAVDTVIRSLADGGLTVVLVSHDLVRAETVADDVRVLHDGRVTARGSAGTVDLAHEVLHPRGDGHVHDRDEDGDDLGGDGRSHDDGEEPAR